MSGNTNCNGVLTLTASVQGGTGCTFTWTEGTTTLGTGSTLSYGPVLDGTCHHITLTATNCNSGCSATASVNIRQCTTTTTGCTTT